MKEIHLYLSQLGFDLIPLDDPDSRHFFGSIITDSNKEVKVLYINRHDVEYKNSLIMHVFKSEILYDAVIARQEIAAPVSLRKHMLNSYELKTQCPVLYQKVLETPA